MATLKKLFPQLVSAKDTLSILKKCIDVRLFGGISTEDKDSVNITGAVQFALLNPSLNKVNLKPHQNTTTFPSKMKTTSGEDQRGSIGTKSIVPYSISQIHGWVNPKSAQRTGATDADLKKMFSALWNQINIINTRSKAGHSSVLLLQIVYNQPFQKIYGVDNLIGKTNKDEQMSDEQIRSFDDFTFDFSKLIDASNSDKIKEIRFYTEIDEIKNEFSGMAKFKELDFSDITFTSQKNGSN